jgi:hypothetical protein
VREDAHAGEELVLPLGMHARAPRNEHDLARAATQGLDLKRHDRLVVGIGAHRPWLADDVGAHRLGIGRGVGIEGFRRRVVKGRIEARRIRQRSIRSLRIWALGIERERARILGGVERARASERRRQRDQRDALHGSPKSTT